MVLAFWSPILVLLLEGSFLAVADALVEAHRGAVRPLDGELGVPKTSFGKDVLGGLDQTRADSVLSQPRHDADRPEVTHGLLPLS